MECDFQYVSGSPILVAMSRSQRLGLLLLLLADRGSRVENVALPVGIQHLVRETAPASVVSCVLDRKPELYGLGIRLGFYFQLISTLLANHFLPDALREAWDANTIFLIAIFVAVVKSSVNVNNLTAPEAFVMLQMLFSFLVAVYHIGRSLKWLLFDLGTMILNGTFDSDTSWMDILSEVGQARRHISNLGITMRHCLALAIASYNVWFWFPGSVILDSDRHCNSSVFVFAQVDLHGNARIFFQVVGVLYLLFQVCKLSSTAGLTNYLTALWIWKVQMRSKALPDELKPTWQRICEWLFDPRSEGEIERLRDAKGEKPQRHVVDKPSLICSC
jgi:hypothetical protein